LIWKNARHRLRHQNKESREREKRVAMKVESMKSMDEECVKIYEESTQVWTTLMEIPKIKASDHKLHNSQEKVQKIKYMMSTLSVKGKLMVSLVVNM
jgi:hypothetical protein